MQSKEFGGPLFSPHVTLLARTPKGDGSLLIQKCQDLVRDVQLFSLTLDSINSEQSFFRVLYIKIQESHEIAVFH